jgi:phosphate transport system permease protein
VESASVPARRAFAFGRRRFRDRFGDVALYAVTLAAGIATVVLVGAIVYKIFDGASLAIRHFGLSFLTTATWDPVKGVFGARDFIFGTLATSAIALVLATPISIAIGLYLSELAPKGIRGVIATLVEMLAAIPSVVLGLWGIFVLGPFLGMHVEPWLHRNLGFIPLFGAPSQAGTGLFTAGLILTIMVVPIISSICRELFLAVPRELEEGALALGTTRWEMVRGVVIPYTRSGITAAVVLGLGRALGEAIAVTQVIGNAAGIHSSVFAPADTIGSKLANQFLNATTKLELSSLFYLAVILLVIGVVTNVFAQWIVGRFEYQRTGAE